MKELVKTLQEINWNFSDYNSSKYPLDINSISSYPATFIPPIPKFLIALLTSMGDTVLDPFGGKGTTAIEAIKQNRIPITNDLNPFVFEGVRAIISIIRFCIVGDNILDNEEERLIKYCVPIDSMDLFIHEHNINEDVYSWYDTQTLVQLLTILNMIFSEKEENLEHYMIRKLVFTSILKQASSQLGHLTYVTDNCKPPKLVYRDANKLYIDKSQQLLLAANELINQFMITNPDSSLSDLLNKVRINTGDARRLDWITDASVKLVLTSPPYLCAQDYIKSMRLTNLFFPDIEGFEETSKLEIGPRSKRRCKADIVVPQYYSDMNMVFSEIERVLVPEGYLCLIIGQGKAKITEAYDTIHDLCLDIINQHKLIELFHTTRKISNRTIQIGGVSEEDIIIFQKSK